MSPSFRAKLGSILRHDAVRLAGVLVVAALLAFLWRDNSAAYSEHNPQARAALPEISGPDLQGRTWSLSAHRGSVVLVNFWATWCPPCRAETPGLVRVANEYRGKGLDVVGVSMDETPDPVPAFVAKFQVPYPIIRPNMDSGPAASIESLPTSLLIDREGRVAQRYVGMVDEGDLTRDIDRLLAER